MSFGGTTFLILEGLTVAGKPLREHNEVHVSCVFGP